MSKISLGQLDLQALQQYLEIVAGFRKADDTAKDVQYVGSYLHPTVDDDDDPKKTEYSPVEANHVAMAALDEEGEPWVVTNGEGVILIPGRQTVVNSLKLGGVDAEDYLKRVESDSILTDVNQATYNMSDDIRNLKDELYQLKNQLLKVGTIKDANVYNGFIDPFIEGSIKHDTSIAAIVTSPSNGVIIEVDNADNFTIGEMIIIESNGEYNLYEIVTPGYNNIEVKPINGVIANIPSGSIIRRSVGISKNGKFVFGHVPEAGLVNVDEIKFIVKDGIERIKVFELDHAGHGYGTEIKIPASLENCSINKVKISLASKGSPGEIQGIFYKYDEAAGTFKATDYKTEKISAMETSGWFNTIERPLLNNTEMPVKPGERYILVMQTSSGSNNDKWFIGGFADNDCPDDVHNDSYILSNNLLYRSLDTTDMFLVLTTKEYKEAEINKLPIGLYTCEFDTYCSRASRIRVELLINQEGKFKVADNINTNYARAQASVIPIETKRRNVINNLVFGDGDTFVVGNEIGTVESVKFNNTGIVPMENLYIKPNADIYRVGYKVQAIVSNNTLDPTVSGVVRRQNDYEKYDLKLVAVVPGRDVIRPYESSDRLIFEAEFYDRDEDSIKLLSFDHVEVQVSWNSNISGTYIDNNEDLEGAILDLTVSVDQAYTSDPEKR